MKLTKPPLRAISVLVLALLLLGPPEAAAQAAQPKPIAVQSKLTPETAAAMALYAYNSGRSDGLLQAEGRCWELATRDAGVRAAGIFCGMVSMANGWVQQAQRQADGLGSLPDFERMASFERFALHAVSRGMSPKELQLAMQLAEKEQGRIKSHIRASGLFLD